MKTANLRPAHTQRLRQRLEAFREGFRQNLALIGPPRSGKTFQLSQLIAQPPEGLFLLYLPMHPEPPATMLARLARALLAAAGLESSEEPLEALLRSAQARRPRLAAWAAAVEALLARRAFAEALTKTLDVIPAIAEERGRPCVLILDEFLCLEDNGFGHAFQELGKRVMTWPNVMFLLASSSPFRARRILRERLHLLFGQFELLEFDPLDPATTCAWLQQELRGLRGARGAAPFLAGWLGTSPWYLTVFLARLHELARLRGADVLDTPLFMEAAWDMLGSPHGTLHQWCASRTAPADALAGAGRALEVLGHIAAGLRTTTELARRTGRAGLTACLQALQEHDVAQRNGTCWVVADPVLRCWLATGVWLQRGDPSLATATVRRRFEQSLQAMWDQWVQSRQLSFPEQMAELFSRFRDETIWLDQKTGRLPRFSAIHAAPSSHPQANYLIAEGPGRRWCCAISEQPVSESAIAAFDAFCRQQSPKPARKVLVARAGLAENARVLAKAASMWVWEAKELEVLLGLYGQSAGSLP